MRTPRGYFQPDGFEYYDKHGAQTYDLALAGEIWAHFFLSGKHFQLPSRVLPNCLVYGSFEYFTPTTASVELTDHCNAHCDYCYRNASPLASHFLVEWRNTLDKICDAGIFAIDLTGGEATTHPDIVDIIHHAASKFEVVRLLTNGYKLPAILPRLESISNIISVQIDIDSVNPELHDRLKQLPGCHSTVISSCSMMKAAGCSFRVAMNVCDENVDQIPAVASLAKRLGASRFSAAPLLPMGRGSRGSRLSEHNHEALSAALNAIYGEYGNFVRKASEDPPPQNLDSPPQCAALTRMIAISPKGDIRPCVLSPLGRLKVGNVAEDLNRVYASDRYNRLARLKPPSLSECKTCDKKYFCCGCKVSPLSAQRADCHFLRRSGLN